MGVPALGRLGWDTPGVQEFEAQPEQHSTNFKSFRRLRIKEKEIFKKKRTAILKTYLYKASQNYLIIFQFTFSEGKNTTRLTLQLKCKFLAKRRKFKNIVNPMPSAMI